MSSSDLDSADPKSADPRSAGPERADPRSGVARSTGPETPEPEAAGPVPAGPNAASSELCAIYAAVVALRESLCASADKRLHAYASFFPSSGFSASAVNLAHYLSLRQHDLRELQERLAENGLSSLGRSEAHILDTIDKLVGVLALMQGSAAPSSHGPRDVAQKAVSYREGAELLRANTDALFGPPPAGRHVRVMVTLPSESASEPELLEGLMGAGMDSARINCAHDDPEIWSAMIRHLRTAEAKLGRRCRILMDLAGHKIRTGPIVLEPSRGNRGRRDHTASLRVHQGDVLILRRDPHAQSPQSLEAHAQDHSRGGAVQISCTCPAVFEFIREGQSVWIDDGKIGGSIESIDANVARVRLHHVAPGGARIKADKGLNLPDTELRLPALSRADLRALDFVAEHADLVGYSFVQSLEDMSQLIEQLSVRGARRLPIIAKIETRRAVANLPEILLGTMGRHPLGVMIARGDLAVELGGERMAEIQEELLWICEAAHVPVIWATQVLETLAKKGIASRPELTDAAMSERAECVMLNKGPYIVEAVRTLIDILGRMEAHQHKKRARLRALHW